MTEDKAAQMSVAAFLAMHIDMSDKSQKDIAREMGYECANMITMLKQGLTKVPLNKVGVLANALGIDAAGFLRMVMAEYMPDTLAAVEEVLQGPMLSANEFHAIRELRRISSGSDPAVVVYAGSQGLTMAVPER